MLGFFFKTLNSKVIFVCSYSLKQIAFAVPDVCVYLILKKIVIDNLRNSHLVLNNLK